MKKILLGNSELKVSEMALGTMYFGWKTPDEEGLRQLSEYSEAGGNFIDTANVYSRRLAPDKDFYGKDFGEYREGTSEKLIGRWLKENKCRHDFVIASKVGFRYPGIELGTSPRQIREECEKSLKRLATDYIDLYYLHMDDENTTLFDSLYTLTELKKEGKIRYVGLSNFKTERVIEAVEIAEKEGFVKPICVQQRYTYLKPRHDADFGRQATADDALFEYVRTSGLSILAYSPLLSGYYVDRTKKLPEQYLTDDVDERINKLHRVANELGISPTQLVYAWMLNLSPEVLPIVATSRSEQFREALSAFEMKLSADVMNELN